MKKTFATALTALTTTSSVAAQNPLAVLQSLPAEVQKDIEHVREGCREYLGADAIQSRTSPEPSASPGSPLATTA